MCVTLAHYQTGIKETLLKDCRHSIEFILHERFSDLFSEESERILLV